MKNISTLIREYRDLKNLTLRQLARELNIHYQRLSEIEREERLPPVSLLRRLRELLNLKVEHRQRFPVPYDAKESNQYKERYRFRHKKDRSLGVRIAAAWNSYPNLMAQLTPRLPSWTRLFLSSIKIDSGLEVVVLYILIVAGAVPTKVKVLQCGMRVHSAVDPKNRLGVGHCLLPALSLNGILFIPQVTLLPQLAKSVYTCDLLVKCGDTWTDLEIDGGGHDSTGDDGRAEFFKIQILRFKEADVLNANFLSRVISTLKNLSPVEILKAA